MPELTVRDHTWHLGDRLLYEPHPGQRAFHEAQDLTRVLKWARRAGKDRGCTFEVLERFLALGEQPRNPNLQPPFWCVGVVPSYKLASQPWHDWMAYLPRELTLGAPIQDEKKIYLKPYGSLRGQWGKQEIGGVLELRSADNEGALQGFGADVLVLFEAQEMTRHQFALLRPSTRDPFRLGLLIVQGIPPVEKDHWMNDLFNMGQEPGSGVFSSRMTYLDNPFLTEAQRADILRDKLLLSETEWARMYMARDPEASESPLAIGPCLVPAVDWSQQRPQEGRHYDIGVDLGKRYSATVIWVWEKGPETWRCAFYRRIQRMDWTYQTAAIDEATRTWIQRGDRGRPTGHVYVDAAGPGDPVYDALAGQGVPVVGVYLSAPERERVLNRLAIALERKRLRIPYEEQIVREFNGMRRVKPSEATETVRWEPREGNTADTVMAAALGLAQLSAWERGPIIRKPAEYYA